MNGHADARLVAAGQATAAAFSAQGGEKPGMHISSTTCGVPCADWQTICIQMTA